MRRNFTFLILLWLATASACGVFGEPTARKLVSASDAEKIAGVPMKFSRETFAERQSSCFYTDADGESDVFLQVTIQEYLSEEQAGEAHEATERIVRQYFQTRTVEGVGDAAFFETDEYSQAIRVRRKNFAFLISIQGGKASEQELDRLRRVAAEVAERL